MHKKLLNIIDENKIELIEEPLSERILGLYADNVIVINKNIATSVEKSCVLAEELGHYFTSYGDILDQTELTNKKQEARARRWAAFQLISVEDLIQACKDGVKNKFELAEYLNISEDFIDTAVEHFYALYGDCLTMDDYTIYFNPTK